MHLHNVNGSGGAGAAAAAPQAQHAVCGCAVGEAISQEPTAAGMNDDTGRAIAGACYNA